MRFLQFGGFSGGKAISFFEDENGMSVNVACQRVTGTGSGYPFLHRLAGVHKSPLSSTLRGHWRVGESGTKYTKVRSSAVIGESRGEYKRPFGEYRKERHPLKRGGAVIWEK